tara:strand:- start:464 stop:820 length:357 start_codon:yes stop_codon:yes gene_type:complete
MGTKLRPATDWDKTIRMPEVKTVLDVKDTIGASVAGAIVRDINNGNLENMGNYQAVAGSFCIQTDQGPVKVGTDRVIVLKDKAGVEHRMDPKDDGTIKLMLDAGMTILRTEEVDIMSG